MREETIAERGRAEIRKREYDTYRYNLRRDQERILRRQYIITIPPPQYYSEEVDFVRDRWQQARCLAIMLDRDYWQVVTADDGWVPKEIAIQGQPAIATFLCGVHEYSTEEIADLMDVERETVTKYISRIDPKRRSE